MQPPREQGAWRGIGGVPHCRGCDLAPVVAPGGTLLIWSSLSSEEEGSWGFVWVPGGDNGCPSGITNPSTLGPCGVGYVMAKTLIRLVISLLLSRPGSRRGSIPFIASLKATLIFSAFSSSCLETGSDSPNVGNNWILNSNSSVKYSVIKLA